jgi:predicted  nucleic acid-binding Zn-ribbon protein
VMDENFAKSIEAALERDPEVSRLKLAALPPQSSLDNKVETFERAREALHKEIERALNETIAKLEARIEEHQRGIAELRREIDDRRHEHAQFSTRVGHS